MVPRLDAPQNDVHGRSRGAREFWWGERRELSNRCGPCVGEENVDERRWAAVRADCGEGRVVLALL